jgi:hypothetical protein
MSMDQPVNPFQGISNPIDTSSFWGGILKV